MSDAKIINEIKKEFYNMTMKFYNDYTQEKTNVNVELYNNMLNLYKRINTCKSLEEVRQCLSEIQKELARLKKVYNEKVDEYNKNKQQSIYQEIKNITKIAQGLTDAYSVAKNLMSKKVKEVKKEEPKKIEEKPKKIVNKDGIDFNIQEVKELEDLTSKIVELKEELATIDPMSKEAISLRRKINELCNQRMQIASEQFGNEGINYIRQVESLETRYANYQEKQNTPKYEVDAEQYSKNLEEILAVIADLKFNGIKSQYVKINDGMTNNEKLKAYQEVYSKYMGEYSNLVKSLHSTSNPIIYSEGDYTVTSTDLLNYLSIYNLKGGYQTFKEHHKSGKVGSEAVSKELYASGLDKIEGFISSFKTISQDLIQSKGGKIVISNQNISKDDMKFEMEQKMSDFYKMITKKQQEKTI